MEKLYKSFGLLILWALCAWPAASAQEVTDTTATVQSASAYQVTGVVLEGTTGQPVSGAYVSVSGYASVLTDDAGKFTLSVPDANAVIQIQGAGYQQKEVAIKGRQTVTVNLLGERFHSVYDAAYLPHAITHKSQVVGAITQVGTRGSWQAPAASPETFLQGRVAGLQMIRRSGTPGIGANMFLRGYASLYGTTQPLVVVDGMVYDMEEYGGSLINNYYTNPLANIDIRDIDYITVLKDAAATALYGAKGSNGVILIRTAHAPELATRIDANLSTGVNLAPKSIPLMPADDYRVLLYDVLTDRGMDGEAIEQLPYMNDDPTVPGYYTYHHHTRWQDQVLDNSTQQNYYLKVTGGDNIAKYALSLGYLNQRGIVKNTGYDRYNTRFNADLSISPKFTVNTNLAFTYGEHTLKDEGIALRTNPILLSLIKAPFLSPHVVSDQGVVSPNLADADVFNVSNPAAIIENMEAQNRNYRFFGSARFNYAFNDRFTLSTLLGITADKIRESLFVPRNGVVADTLDNAVAESKMQSQIHRLFSVYNETHLRYEKQLTYDHHVRGVVGFRYRSSKSEEDIGTGYNSPTDDLKSLGTGVTTLRQVGGEIGEWRWLSMFASADYQFKNRYFLTLNVATDGSSRFGDDTKGISLFNKSFGVFPAAGVAWQVSSEPFMAAVDALDLVKLRLSYGAAGNDDIGNYSAQLYYASQNFLGVQGLVRGNLYNPHLQWETNTKFNAGLDLAILNEKASLSLDVYHHHTTNLLVFRQTPAAAGLSTALTNDGALTNRGIEVSLHTRLIDRPGLSLEAGATLQTFRNKVDKLPDGDIVTELADAWILTREGQAANLFYGYQSKGVYQTNAAAATTGYQRELPDGSLVPFQAGDMIWVDQNNDQVINDDDRTIIGNPNPDITGSVFGTLRWQRFTLDAMFTFSVGNDVYNYPRRQLESSLGYNNQTRNIVNRWQANGQDTDVPRATWGDPLGNAAFSDRWIEDGSYLRLKTLSVAYDVPFSSNFLKYVSAYITATNLFTLTDYLGYDPEFSATRSALGQGMDLAGVPQHTSLMAGLRMGL